MKRSGYGIPMDLEFSQQLPGRIIRGYPAGLLRFLEHDVLPSYTQRRTELKNRSLIRRQAFGEAFDPERLEKLSRYEVHLDRKLEKTLAMLIRLQELRDTANPE